MTAILYIPSWYLSFTPSANGFPRIYQRLWNNLSSFFWKQIVYKKPIYCRSPDRNLIHYFWGVQRKSNTKVIHFNRAVSVLLATFPPCASFEFHIRHCMCVCQHNTVNNKGATVAIGNCKSWNSFEGREYLFTLMIKPFIDFLENPIFSLQASENLSHRTAISRRSLGL